MSEAPTWLWFVLGGLLALSGMFSASETALFSLTRTELAYASDRVRSLLKRSRDLLVSVLLANLVINVLYFAFAARLQQGTEGFESAAVAGSVLAAVLLFGEILPKILGLRLRQRWASIAAGPLLVLIFVLGPIRRFVIGALEGISRLTTRIGSVERSLSPDDLAHVLEAGAEDGHLLGEEAELIAEIVELESMRVREIMTPRVDMLFLELDGTQREEVLAQAAGQRISWLPVIDGNADRVAGRVRVRDLFNQPNRALAQLVMPVKFVPEVASCLDLLQSFREDRTAEAVVVDEWGGTAGVVTIEDLFEEIVGELRVEGEERVPPAVPLGEGRYRVSGGLSIRDWNDAFGFRVVPTEFETVAGFVTAQLGRIPKSGDTVRYGDLLLQVDQVRGRRILSVDMAVAPADGEEEL